MSRFPGVKKLMSHGTCTGPVLLKNIVRSLDDIMYFRCTEIANIYELSGLHPLDQDQGFALDPLGGLTAP